jgi:hypothetical protein
MITSNKLKIWTLITHGFIIVGAGHGSACLFLLEGLSFIDAGNRGNFNILDPYLAIPLLMLIGQLSIIFSMRNFRPAITRTLLIAGVMLLYIPIGNFIFVPEPDGLYFATLTAFPFFICTVFIFFGDRLKNAWRYFIDHIP